MKAAKDWAARASGYEPFNKMQWVQILEF